MRLILILLVLLAVMIVVSYAAEKKKSKRHKGKSSKHHKKSKRSKSKKSKPKKSKSKDIIDDDSDNGDDDPTAVTPEMIAAINAAGTPPPGTAPGTLNFGSNGLFPANPMGQMGFGTMQAPGTGNMMGGGMVPPYQGMFGNMQMPEPSFQGTTAGFTQNNPGTPGGFMQANPGPPGGFDLTAGFSPTGPMNTGQTGFGTFQPPQGQFTGFGAGA